MRWISVSRSSTRWTCRSGTPSRGGAQRDYLLVDTRFSAVLGIVFGQKADWSDLALTFILALITVFLLVEIASLYAGVKLTRTITGAVHELYEGTQHVQQGDFSYRIPVQGKDQLAELSQSFNAMTQNLGRLIVVAKEKERLESELGIAREVQNQLFPKHAPDTTNLELRGVCNPARMVSGDYYDFMTLPNELAGLRDRRRGGQRDLGRAADGVDSIHHAHAVERGTGERHARTTPPRRWWRR